MGTPEDLSTCRDAGLAYCDQASQYLQQKLGRAPDLEEVATFYAAAVGAMQGAVVALVQEMSGIDDVRAWMAHVSELTQTIARGKKAPLTITQETTVTLDPPPAAAAANGHPVPEAPAAKTPTAEAPSPEGAHDKIPCACFNKTGMCVVCLEGMVTRLTKAAGWVAQVQELQGALDADCPACTPRILDRAVALAMKKTAATVHPDSLSQVISAVVSALPQLTGHDHWPETIRLAEQLCPSLVQSTE